MSVQSDYASLADRLIAAYTSQSLRKTVSPVRPRSGRDQQLAHSLFRLSSLDHYKDPAAIDAVLDTIDLASIYEGVEKREAEYRSKLESEKIEGSASNQTSQKLLYDDFLVQETLHYFKHSFFKWVTRPECDTCHQAGDNIVSVGNSRFPDGVPNPDQVSVIEHYRCNNCQVAVDFARVGNAVSLLRTRKGRCGEWVDCFLLILHALVPQPNRLRYVWNQEDHVWVEYYSNGLERWVHLDPCEAAFDEPLIYANNWGKKMSLVVGFNDYYIIDLSEKYIPPKSQIDRLSVVSSEAFIQSVIATINSRKLADYEIALVSQGIDGLGREQTGASATQRLLQIYSSVLLPYNREVRLNRTGEVVPTKTSDVKGRQTGGVEWTRARGEDGK